MKNADWYLEKYGESHQNPKNILIHKIFVPLIMFSVIGLLWAIPLGNSLPWYLNLGVGLVIISLIFYFSMGPLISFFMLLIVAPMIYGNYLLAQTDVHLISCILIFVVSWIMQFYGHKIEGKKPSFLEDLLFLLVGPVWVFYPVYKKLGF